MNCPVCTESLVATDRQGIEIDYCPRCRGVWLDRGELEKIIQRAAQPYNASGQPGASSSGFGTPPGMGHATPGGGLPGQIQGGGGGYGSHGSSSYGHGSSYGQGGGSYGHAYDAHKHGHHHHKKKHDSFLEEVFDIFD